MSKRRDQGVTLLFTMALLALLFLFGFAFLQGTALERRAAATLVDQARAEAVARAGIHFSVAQLRDQALSQAIDSDSERWRFPHGTALSAAAEAGVPVSFQKDFTGDLAAVAAAQGLRRSGSLGGVVPEADHFQVKVIDCASQLNLNGQQASLSTMIEVLGAELEADGLGNNPVPSGSGDLLIAFREALPNRRFVRKSQLLDALASLPDVDTDEAKSRFALLADFVAVYGYFDAGSTKAESAAAKLVPRDPGYDLVPRRRYPVNINTAPRPLLVATLANLGGAELAVLDEPFVIQTDESDVNGQSSLVGLATSGATLIRRDISAQEIIDIDTARALADAIITRRGGEPFRCREDLRVLLSTLSGAAALSEVQRAVVLVNATPSAILNDFNPDRFIRDLLVQKTDIFYQSGTEAKGEGTVEFCFSSMGWYEIESLGRVMDAAGEIQAEAQTTVVAKVYDVIRHSSQRDFVAAGPLDGNGGSSTVTGEPAELLADLQVEFYPEPISALGAAAANPGIDSFKAAASASMGHVSWKPAPSGLAPPQAPNATLDENFDGGFGDLSGDKQLASLLTGNGDLSPDGVLSWRRDGRRRELELAPTGDQLTNAFNKDEGYLEFFIKLMTDPQEGTDEAILFLVQDYSDSALGRPQGVTKQGITWRVERFGTRLLSTRFWWGEPKGRHPALPEPIPFEFAVAGAGGVRPIDDPTQNRVVFSEVEVNLGEGAGGLNWRAGEWHHVLITWFDVDGVPEGTEIPVCQEVYIDGDFIGGYDRATGEQKDNAFPTLFAAKVEVNSNTSSAISNQTSTDTFTAAGFDFDETVTSFDNVFSDDDVAQGTTFIDNGAGGVTVVGATVDDVKGKVFTSTLTQTTTIDTITTVTTHDYEVRQFQLRSAPPDETFKLGGYKFEPEETATLFRVGVQIQAGAELERFSNCTIDELRVFSGKPLDIDATTEHPRYEVSISRSNPATFVGHMRVPEGSRLGTLSFSVVYPPERRDFDPANPNDQPKAINTVLDAHLAFGTNRADVPFDPADPTLLENVETAPHQGHPSKHVTGIKLVEVKDPNKPDAPPPNFDGQGLVLRDQLTEDEQVILLASDGDFFYGLQWARENSPEAIDYWEEHGHEAPFALLDVTVTAVGSTVFVDQR